MATRLGNIAALFKDGKTRAIILVTVFILIAAVVLGIVSMRNKKGVPAVAQLSSAPGGIQSVPFKAPNEEYAELQAQQNAELAKKAEQVGGSAIPTIINSDKTNIPVSNAGVGVGFTALSREQSDAGTFVPKEFQTPGAVVCPPLLQEADKNKLGTPIYDANGRLIGYAGADGKVRDITGKIIGTVGPDGVVRDSAGKVIGQESKTISGTPVYDSNGKLLGYVGEDGKVRDLTGKIIGTVGPDGQVRDITGKVIGALGKPVYDKNGKLLGFEGPDGKIRDAAGNVIGTVDSEGIARDLAGNIIGKAGAISPGTPVYGANGQIIGHLGPDGKVRDANGNIIGNMGVDGLVRDADGRVIGGIAPPAKPENLGKPVYGADGEIIGHVGPDGIVRDANGNIIGKMGPDGLVRNAAGEIIGKGAAQTLAGPNLAGNAPVSTTAIPVGTPIYDSNGKLIGYTGPDGVVRDLNGRVIGKVGADGVVRSADGRIIGSTETPEQRDNEKMQQLYQEQQKILKDQNLSQLVQQKQQAMSTQANQLLAAWASPIQQYVAGQQPTADSGQAAQSDSSDEKGVHINIDGTGASKGKSGGASGPVFIKAGTVYFAVINTAIDSDQPGPVMATIINGDYKGGKLLGSMVNQGQAVLLTFNILTLPQFPKSIPINAVAIDQNTARTALSTETNNHYLLRYGSLFAASFMEGYAEALTSSGGQSTTNIFGTTTKVTPDLTGSQKLYVALGNVGTQFSSQMSSVYTTPPTVYVASGTAVGILFMGDAVLPVS